MDAAEKREMVDRIMKRWEEAAGDWLVFMLNTREDAEYFAEDRDAKLRRVAFDILRRLWPPVRESEVLYAKAALNDPDEEVRLNALTCLAQRYLKTGDKNASAVAAMVALDHANTVVTRATAYVFLCMIRDAGLTEPLVKEICRVTDQLPPGIDWEMVRQCATVYGK